MRRQERAERRGQVLGLPRGRGHGEHEPAGAVPASVGAPAADAGRERGDEQRPQRGRRDEVTLARAGHVGGLASAVRSWESSATAASSPARLMMSQRRR